MPNGDEYARMESEADRILYTKYQEVKDDVKRLDDKLNAIIVLLLTILGGLVYSLL